MDDRKSILNVIELIKFFENREINPEDASILCAALIVSCSIGPNSARALLEAVIESDQELINTMKRNLH